MFRINKEKNIVETLEQATFSELGFRERLGFSVFCQHVRVLNQDWAGFVGLAGFFLILFILFNP